MLIRHTLRSARRLFAGSLTAACEELPLLGRSLSRLAQATGIAAAAASSSGICSSDRGGEGDSRSSGSSGTLARYTRLSSSMATSGSVWRGFSTSPAAAAVAAAAAAAAAAAKPNKQAAAHELPLWCFLRQCGFSAAAISWMQHRVKGTRTSQQKVEQDLVPNIAALRAVGLDTATIERLYVSRPLLLHTSNATCIGALEVPRPLAALLPGDPCAVQAPPRATQLGVALWLYPAPAAELLRRRNLARLISGNLPLRQRLGISGSATAQAIFSNSAVLASDMQQAEALAAHLQRLQASGQLSAEQVARLALEPSGLSLSPAEFDRRRREGGAQALACIGLKDPKGRQQAAAAALGELLQAAAGVPGPLQQQHQQQGAALVKRCAAFMRATPTSLRANWAALHRTGLADGDIAAIVQQQPAVLTGNWEGDAKQLMAAWLQQELGLSLAQFLRRHVSHANKGVGRLAMRAAYLQQHRPAVWQRCYVRGAGAAADPPVLKQIHSSSVHLAARITS